jgi:hypothetical protein
MKIFALSCLAWLASPAAAAADFAAPVFQVDLSEDASTRWSAPVSYMIETYGFDNSYQTVLDYVYSLVPEETVEKLEPLLLKLELLFPEK